MADAFELSFAGVGFTVDSATVVRADQTPRQQGTQSFTVDAGASVRKHQPLADFVEELDRLMPFRYIRDFDYPGDFPGPRIDALALPTHDKVPQDVKTHIGEFYYPSTASKWAVFRGLATSTQVKRMMAATSNGTAAAAFVMQATPVGSQGSPVVYRVSTPMRILAPRCVGETLGDVDGMYLVTLVDERYYFQGTTVSIDVPESQTWAGVVTRIAAALGVTVTFPDLPAVYERPESDTQLWSFRENAAALLDAVAGTLGCVVVRDLDGNYALVRHETSAALAAANRVNLRARTAGGNMFTASGMPVGSLAGSRNGVVPRTVNVSFPKYVYGDDPVPHSLNPRYAQNRPSAWYEASPDVYTVAVPITSGGPFVSGVTGVSDDIVHVAGKALYSGEAAPFPVNEVPLTALAQQVAQDRYTYLASVALDETYPGIVKVLPEGLHDIVWTYSVRRRQATTRVVRGPWTILPHYLQHAAPAMSGQGWNPRGVGGPSVAQTHVGAAYPTNTALSGGGMISSGVTAITASLAAPLTSGGMTASFARVDYLPTDYRWRGTISGEAILFEGTSGGASSGTASTVGIARRAIDGTLQGDYVSGSTVTMTPAPAVYGVNLVEAGKMQFVRPGVLTSGGIQGAVLVPQTQTVTVLSDTGVSLNGVTHYSGQVNSYNPTKVSGLQFPVEQLAWVVERNYGSVTSGKRYDGQLLGYSPTEVNASGFMTRPAAPVYGVDQPGGASTTVPATQWTYYGSSGTGSFVSGTFIAGRQHLLGFKQFHGETPFGGVTNIQSVDQQNVYEPGAVIRILQPGQTGENSNTPLDSFGRHVAMVGLGYYDSLDPDRSVQTVFNYPPMWALIYTTDDAPLTQTTFPRVGYFDFGVRPALQISAISRPLGMPVLSGGSGGFQSRAFLMQQLPHTGDPRWMDIHDMGFYHANDGSRLARIGGAESYAAWGYPKTITMERIYMQNQRGWTGTLADGTVVVEGVIVYGGASGLAGPQVTAISQGSGAVGDTLIITGTGFDNPSVTVDGVAATVSGWTGTSIPITVPTVPGLTYDNQLIYGRIGILNSGGLSGFSRYAYTSMGLRWQTSNTVAVPTIAGLSPTSGTVSGGTGVTLSGTTLDTVQSVTIGGRSAVFLQYRVPGPALQFRTPPGLSGPQDVVVTDVYGRTVTRSGGFTYG